MVAGFGGEKLGLAGDTACSTEATRLFAQGHAGGTEVRVMWQIQGNNELGLPTKQDLDIFVALGAQTFQNNMRVV